MDVPANLRPGAFVGAAEAYARYRPPYPRSMLDDLLTRAGIDARGDAAAGTLLDLAAGPGRIALDLAGSFAEVLAIDLEPEMVEVGERLAAARGIDNIRWQVGRAEGLEIEPESLDLITIGEAFHRVEQAVVAANGFRWLRRGGCLATLGSDGRFRDDEPWQVTLRSVRERWVERAFPEGYGVILPGQAEGEAGREAVLRAAGFVDVASHHVDEAVDVPFESIVGILESSSVCSRKVLGPEFEAFRSELRDAIGAEQDTRFPETIHWSYTLARKPRS